MRDLDKIMALIQNHLARAEHPNTPPAEADLARTQAEKLMAKYRVEEWEAAQAGETGPIKPIWHTLDVANLMNEWWEEYITLANYVFHHTGVKSKFEYGYDKDGRSIYTATILGFESDVRYAEMLWSGIRIAFGKRLEPQFDPMESDAANAYRMRAGGMERRRIAMQIFGSWDTEAEMKAKNRKVTALIKKGAEEAGADADDLLGRGNNIKTFRKSYAESFRSEMWRRLTLLRSQVGLESSAVVLSSRRESLDEAWYERYPGDRPVDTAGAIGSTPRECDRCKKAKSGRCREHRPLVRTRQSQAYSEAGLRHGRAAAREVDLGYSSTPAVR